MFLNTLALVDSPITLSSILTMALIVSVTFGVTNVLGKWVMSYLSLKFGKDTPSQEMAKHSKLMAEQSQQCRFDHEGINKLILTQNKNIEALLGQNGEQIRALTDANHNAQLRHQIVIAEMKEGRAEVMNKIKELESKIGG